MSSQQPKQSWQHDERHYCSVCNAWMGSDRQSILIHENGKKHQENVERALQEKRVNKQKEGQAQKFLADSLKQMEAAAAALAGGGTGAGAVANNSQHQQQGGTGPQPPPIPSNNHAYHSLPHHHNHYPHHHPPPPPPHPNAIGSSWLGPVSAAPQQQQQLHYPQQQPHNTYQSAPSSNYSNNNNNNNNNINTNNKQLQQQEKIDWQAQKLKREEINTKKRNKGGEESDEDEDQEVPSSNKRPKITFHPDEGFYTYNDNTNTDTDTDTNTNNDVVKNEDMKENDCDAAITQQKATAATTTTYLEGPVFFGLLCEEMPVEIWSGPSSYSGLEKRLSKNSVFWKDSLVVAVVMTNNSKVKAANDEDVDEDDDGIQRPIIHVSYLKTLDDTEETIEKNVSVDRIRIILGGDKTIPDTIEACRLLALGGEEVQVSNNNNDQDDAKMMEATGLSGWSTVTIKKTSILQESRDEKEKLKEQRRQVRADREAEQRRTEARRMEEAKVSNADDSALGAYDVWGKGEYKGIDISKELDCPIEETAKRLAGASSTKGKISFKKRTKKKGAGMARRKTSADDD